MATTEKPIDIQDYIGIGLRRKWYIIIPMVFSIAISAVVYKALPKIYEATTLILVQAQGVPENYVRSTITDPMTSRLNTISQEILSRTRLETVIQEFNLYLELRSNIPMERIVEVMRKAIEVKVEGRPYYDRGQNSFSVSYEGREPRTVMLVTNKLASLFIEENLRFRAQQAENTSDFMAKELLGIEDRLKKNEIAIRDYKGQHMGQLPEQLDANLRILERLQQQLQTTSENIRSAEDRAILLRSQIELLKERETSVASRTIRREPNSGSLEIAGDQGPEDPLIAQYNALKRDLTAAQSKYTESHPDVIDLKRKITTLEPRVKELLDDQQTKKEAREKQLQARRGANGDALPFLASDPVTERLLTQYTDQYNESQLEAKRLRGEEETLKEQFTLYRRRIEETPRREQELALLTRDYDLLKTNYQSLLDKGLQAQMAENLERKQQGEQFRVLDPARIPEKPVRPDRNKILLMGLLIGLSVGVGLAWFRESLDQSFHTVSDIEDYLELPVVATIPYLKEEGKAAA